MKTVLGHRLHEVGVQVEAKQVERDLIVAGSIGGQCQAHVFHLRKDLCWREELRVPPNQTQGLCNQITPLDLFDRAGLRPTTSNQLPQCRADHRAQVVVQVLVMPLHEACAVGSNDRAANTLLAVSSASAFGCVALEGVMQFT